VRILHVDDDALAVRLMRRELTGFKDVELVGVTSPQDAMELLEAEDWDVVVSDFAMPNMDGVELLEHVVRLQPSARRLLLTANPDAVRVEAARRAGLAEEVLAKPVPFSVLVRALGLEGRPRSPTPRGTPMAS
jgi:CheY-like chemotaxis protein